MRLLAGLREFIGWILLGIGLATFGLAGYLVLGPRQACSASVVTVIAIFIFWGGMNLIRLAVAGRAAAESRDEVLQQPARVVRRPVVVQQSLAAPRPNAIPGPKSEK